MSEKAERLCNEGLALMTRHLWLEAEEKMTEARDADNTSPEIWYNLGKCQFHRDHFGNAILSLNEAIRLRSGEPYEEVLAFPIHGKKYPEALALLGSCYYAVHDLQRAWYHFMGAVHPDNTEEFNRECETAGAHAKLARGDYDRWSWSDYQQRLAEPDTWDGSESLRGKTLLIKAEGGLGDQIFFARYNKSLKTLGAGYVLWEMDEPLTRYARLALDLDVATRGKELPEYDYMIHAGSLPHVFDTKPGTIPLHSESFRFPDVKNFYTDCIGLAWSGNPMHSDDHHRSIPLAAFAPLFKLGKNFYPMQKDIPYRDRDAFNMSKMEEPEFEDIDDMKDAFDCIDLIITVDTMTAHLAGAEGIPTFLLLPYACDWRWKLEGDRTEWYPSIKIFRQGADRRWEPVIQRVVEELNGQ